MVEPQSRNPTENKSVVRGVETARRILNKTLYRPEPTEVRNLTKADIDTAAKQLNYPVYDIAKYESFHEMALPLIAKKAHVLLEENEKRKPTYVIFGRDGDMMYDALASVASGTDLARRVHLINLGRAHVDQVEVWPDKTLKYQEHIRAYLGENDISSQILQTGNFVFFDSGYRGSMFDFVLKMGGTSREAMKDRMKGYLLLRGELNGAAVSPYHELGWPKGTRVDKDFFSNFYNGVAKNWEQLGSWGPNTMLRHLDTERKVNWALANYLQIQPKYTRPSFDVEHVDGKWHSLPFSKDRGYPIKNFHLWETKNVTEPIEHPNSCAVDPVAALKLQTATVNYFTNRKI